MLHSLIGGSVGAGKYVPFSFADRGNLWPSTPVDGFVPAQAQHDAAGIAQGLIAGTLVATETGWQPVDDLQPGDRIVTFDHGMRPLRAVRISTLYTAAEAAPQRLWPLSIPAGVLGNRSALKVLPDQPVLIESDAAEVLYGDAFLMLPVGVLDGYRGITRVPPAREMSVVALEFDNDEVVYVNGTLLAQCPAPEVATTEGQIERLRGAAPLRYQRLTEQQGRRLVEAMQLGA
ncbi:MAG: Hint domain-containing protein [Proteobacteria bacterium]|nr:Hint domain-containing protein [Pseudomonadota bacterium]